MFKGLRFRVEGLRFRVKGLGLKLLPVALRLSPLLSARWNLGPVTPKAHHAIRSRGFEV